MDRKKYNIPDDLRDRCGRGIKGLLKIAASLKLSETQVIETIQGMLTIFDGLGNFKTYELPTAGAQLGMIKSAIFFSLGAKLLGLERCIDFYAGSCPDYSHKNGLYTHKSVGSGLPLLSKLHVDEDVPLIKYLLEHGVECRYILMLADVEATDDVFCRRFTNGSEEEFLRRCAQSMEETKKYLQRAVEDDRRFIASSFFSQFGRERFMVFQEQYQDFLLKKFATDTGFRYRVTLDVAKRKEMYSHMYPRKKIYDREDFEFLAQRTIRTMSQYRVLADLIEQDSAQPVVINHPTVNISIYNEGGLSLNQNNRVLPVIVLKKRIY